MIARLQAKGCDAVILDCNELPLIINDGNSPLPTLDSTRLLARAALQRAVGPPDADSTPARSRTGQPAPGALVGTCDWRRALLRVLHWGPQLR